MEAINAAFPGAFQHYDHMNVNAGGYRVSLGARLRNRWVQVEQAERTPVLMVDCWGGSNITDAQLSADIRDYAVRREAFGENCQKAYNEAMSVLQTMQTIKKLQEGWPEAIPVIGDLIPMENRTLPVVQVKEINEKFGLPPKE